MAKGVLKSIRIPEDILASIGHVNGEMDIVPLNDLAFRRLTALGIITD